MNLKFTLITLLAGLSTTFVAQAQYAHDVVRYSQESSGGSARFKGLGNANTALGGDLSSISGNPAGLGFYGQSDIGITFNYMNNRNKADFSGNSATHNKGIFAVDQAAIVLHLPTQREGYNLTEGWLNFNMGLSYDRTNDFLNKQIYSGVNSNNSIVNSYIDFMDFNPGHALTNDIYNSYLAETIDGNDNQFFPVVRDNGDKHQRNEVLNSGNRSRTNLSFGANYSNKFYIGASLGMSSFKYESRVYFEETQGWTKSRNEILDNNPNSEIADPNNEAYDYVEANYAIFDDFEQYSDGSGVDFKIGMIYKPTADWNLGFTYTSPTWMTVTDNSYEIKDVYYYDNETVAEPFSTFENDYEYPYEYNMITPMKFAVGVSKLFGSGLLSADVEYIDYASAKFRTIGGRDTQFEADNNSIIKDSYTGVVNARVGGEILFTNLLSGRAGFNYYGNPYKNSDQTHFMISAGFGAKLTNSLYLDLAVMQNVLKYSESPYIIDAEHWGSSSPVADIVNQRTNAVLTLGAKF